MRPEMMTQITITISQDGRLSGHRHPGEPLLHDCQPSSEGTMPDSSKSPHPGINLEY